MYRNSLWIKILVAFLILFPPTGPLVADLAYGYFGCQGDLKNLKSCFINGYDIVGLLGIGIYWCKVLWIPFWLVAVAFVYDLYRRKTTNNDNT